MIQIDDKKIGNQFESKKELLKRKQAENFSFFKKKKQEDEKPPIPSNFQQ